MTDGSFGGTRWCLAVGRRLGLALVVAFLVGPASDPARAQNRSESSPAAAPVPETATPQSYAADLVESGRAKFAAECGFCHGRDAAGGSGGPDLTRSLLVAQDVRGDRIGLIVRSGRVDAGMPAFPGMSQSDLSAIVAFIHDEKTRAETAVGGRRSVEPEDLATGNARAGQRYFARNCSGCHAADGDLAGIASRLEGLALMMRMLYPGSEARGAAPPPPPPTVTVTTSDGRVVTGALAYRDEFTIALIDSADRYRSWSTDAVDFDVDDPLQAHAEQLGRYTDEDMHDVLAYLQTLR
jgi:cytochrome c oxidase cbb3-type subunit III